jgi:hypothetical protein
MPPRLAGGLSESKSCAMCKKCTELDDKIAHYKRISTYITDQITLDGIAGLIRKLEVEKAALHPE